VIGGQTDWPHWTNGGPYGLLVPVGQYPGLFREASDELAVTYPDDVEEIGLIHTALIKIGEVIRASPPVNGQGAV
jgi:hypothetical protein